ncbi:YncE family protein [Winogradskyella sediminis]|uniref:YncE family protein n=1 Tax=Winogradskyella sediminis TaxID=1382466 RepID=UPI000E36D63F|nr:YncE family protein [Winogradskyella sediminis]REG87360.1 YVTN family beta-propeller protein [Winogradskyella sediminis]
MKKIILSIFAMSLLIVSCSSDDDATPSEPLGAYEDGIIVSGEGGPSSISFISEDLMTSENQIYFNVNNEATGVYLQSLGFNDDKAYIVVDAGTITVVNRYTFEKLGTISTGLTTPRYIAFANGKGYITNWGDPYDETDDFVAVVDLTANTVISTIPVGNGPEQILAEDNVVYVSHKGAYTTNNIVSVINTSSDVLTTTITVNDNPDEMLVDDNGDLVVLSSGKPAWTGDETKAAITKIDMDTNTVSTTLEFSDGEHPELMTYLNGHLYYNLGSSILSITDDATAVTSIPLFTTAATTLYGMAAKDDRLYFADAVDYTSAGQLFIYDDTSYSLINSFNAPVVASKIYFN